MSKLKLKARDIEQLENTSAASILAASSAVAADLEAAKLACENSDYTCVNTCIAIAVVCGVSCCVDCSVGTCIGCTNKTDICGCTGQKSVI